MIFALEALRAKHGDSLILHFGTREDPRFILIDGGPGGVYRSTLDRRLEQLRGLRPEEPLRLELVMVSHIDDDHIRGILDLTAELVELRDRRLPLTREVLGFWHNSFDDIVGPSSEAGVASLRARFASLIDDVPFDPQGLRLDRPPALVAASVPQGRELRNRAKVLGWRVNRPFGELVTLEREGPRDVQFDGGLTLTVLGPRAERVETLQREWDSVIRERGLAQPPPDGEVAALLDQSVYNLASIIVLAESGDKQMLLTGDARGDDIRDGLRAAGLLNGRSVHFDILKLPHHGSVRNVNEEFFQRVTADHYVISANGKHGNPDVEALELLTEARGSDPYTIHLTNRTGKEELEAKLSNFFRRDRRRNRRRYRVRSRRQDKLSLFVNLGSERATR